VRGTIPMSVVGYELKRSKKNCLPICRQRTRGTVERVRGLVRAVAFRHHSDGDT